MRMTHRILAAFLFLGLVAAGWLPAQEASPTPTAKATPFSVPKRGLDAVGNELGEAADSALTQVDWFTRDVGWGITGSRVIVTLVGLIVVAIVAGILLRIIRLRSGRLQSPDDQSWLQASMSAARKPLALLVWSYGVYVAAFPVIDAIADDGNRQRILKIAGRLADIGGLFAAFWLVMRLTNATQKKMRHWAQGTKGFWDNLIVEIVGRVLRLAVPLLAAILLVPLLHIPNSAELIVQKAMGIFLIIGIATLVIRSTVLFEKALLEEHQLDAADNLQARKIYTQVSVIRKIIVAGVIVIAVGSVLMMFSVVRQLGTSILASAGIAGIVLGFAAQKTLGNLLAGIQIAISQPIRIDDVVIVENEWGRIEEITLTYVVVKIWDLRRLVVPITYFVEKPFQNWTRNESKLLGSIFLHVDYHVPLDELRAELKRLCENDPLWDGEYFGLQVTDAKETCLEVRCLATSADAPKGWDLRCNIREGLINFVAKNYPDSLPRFRADLDPDGKSESRAPMPPPAS